MTMSSPAWKMTSWFSGSGGRLAPGVSGFSTPPTADSIVTSPETMIAAPPSMTTLAVSAMWSDDA
ncbi:MAG: hypothetical protein HMLKMBBP_01378 [Planctomycetes bacterium]|nr:hypothetical protein [Planctomycetota bacterium]